VLHNGTEGMIQRRTESPYTSAIMKTIPVRVQRSPFARPSGEGVRVRQPPRDPEGAARLVVATVLDSVFVATRRRPRAFSWRKGTANHLGPRGVLSVVHQTLVGFGHGGIREEGTYDASRNRNPLAGPRLDGIYE